MRGGEVGYGDVRIDVAEEQIDVTTAPGGGELDEAVEARDAEEEFAEADERPATERGAGDARRGAVADEQDRRAGAERDEEVRLVERRPGALREPCRAARPRVELRDDAGLRADLRPRRGRVLRRRRLSVDRVRSGRA